MMNREPKVTVKRTGRTWSIYIDGQLSEGFFSRERAEAYARVLREEIAGGDGLPCEHCMAGANTACGCSEEA